jgi:hypothetical protein
VFKTAASNFFALVLMVISAAESLPERLAAYAAANDG